MKVYETTDYKKFKFLEGNRDITERRVKKILKSIKDVGYLPSICIVNEDLQVIDGQARITAFEVLGLPVHYVIAEGAGVRECISLNINQTNWNDRDYIESYAKTGSEDYCRFRTLLDETKAPMSIALCALYKNFKHAGGWQARTIRDGTLKCSKDDYSRAKWELEWCMRLDDVAKIIGGRRDYFHRALLYTYRNLTAPQRMEIEEKIRKNAYMIPSFTDVSAYLKYFDEFYNKNKTKKNKINLELQWATDNL